MNGSRWVLNGKVADLVDGEYIMAIRPHHVTPDPCGPDSIEVQGTVLVTELSGSDSSAHFEMDSDSWVSLAHGVHRYQVGQKHQFYVDVSHAFYFDHDGRLVV